MDSAMGTKKNRNESDSDQSDEEVSQDILERLNAYGNSLLGDDERRTAKVKKSKSQRISNTNSGSLQSANSTKKSTKKKKKKKADDDGEEDGVENDETDIPVKRSQVDKLKNMLSLTEEEIAKLKEKKSESQNASKRDTTLDPVMTDANRLKRKKRPPPEIIVFNDPAKRSKTKKPKKAMKEEEERDEDEDGEEFNLKRARWEVQRMGIKALDKQEKEEAQIALAVKLGAAPPKKSCINYKDLMEKRKKERKEEEEKKEMMRKLGYKAPKTVDYKRRKRDINDVGRLDGQIGKFKFGVQKISHEDVNKLNKTKSGKQSKHQSKR